MVAVIAAWATADAAATAEMQGRGFDWWSAYGAGWVESRALLLGVMAWIMPTVVVTALRPQWTAPARMTAAMTVAAVLVAYPAVNFFIFLIQTDGFGGGPAQVGAIAMLSVPVIGFFLWGIAIGVRVGLRRLVLARRRTTPAAGVFSG